MTPPEPREDGFSPKDRGAKFRNQNIRANSSWLRFTYGRVRRVSQVNSSVG